MTLLPPEEPGHFLLMPGEGEAETARLLARVTGSGWETEGIKKLSLLLGFG